METDFRGVYGREVAEKCETAVRKLTQHNDYTDTMCMFHRSLRPISGESGRRWT